MNATDENIRDAITDAFTRQGIDARGLAVEVVESAVSVRGSVPSEEQRARLGPAVASAMPDDRTAQIAVSVAPVPQSATS